MGNKKQSQRQHVSGNPARRTASRQKASGQHNASNGGRTRLNHVSAPLLLRLHALPRWTIPVVMGLALASGLFLTDELAWLGTLLLMLVAVFVGWLLALSWPVLSPGARLARGLVVAALVGLTVLKAIGRL